VEFVLAKAATKLVVLGQDTTPEDAELAEDLLAVPAQIHYDCCFTLHRTGEYDFILPQQAPGGPVVT